MGFRRKSHDLWKSVSKKKKKGTITTCGLKWYKLSRARGAFNNASARRATGRTPPERERSPARYRALATQAGWCVAYTGTMATVQFLISSALCVALFHIYLLQYFYCSIDQMKCFSMLVSAIYVHNRLETEIEINKLSERSLSFNSTTFCPSRARRSARIPERTSDQQKLDLATFDCLVYSCLCMITVIGVGSKGVWE